MHQDAWKAPGVAVSQIAILGVSRTPPRGFLQLTAPDKEEPDDDEKSHAEERHHHVYSVRTI